MRFTKYSRFVPGSADEINLQGLLDQLSDFLLQSGFAGGDPYWGEGTGEGERSLEALKAAILKALLESGQLTPEMLRFLRGESAGGEERDAEVSAESAALRDGSVRRLIDEGFLTMDQAPQMPQGYQPVLGPGGQARQAARQVAFGLTEKVGEFLGYRTRRILLHRIGRAGFCSHDHPYLATLI